MISGRIEYAQSTLTVNQIQTKMSINKNRLFKIKYNVKRLGDAKVYKNNAKNGT